MVLGVRGAVGFVCWVWEWGWGVWEREGGVLVGCGGRRRRVRSVWRGGRMSNVEGGGRGIGGVGVGGDAEGIFGSGLVVIVGYV